MKFVATTIKTPWVPISVIVDIEKSPVVRACSFESIEKLMKKAGPEFTKSTVSKVSKIADVSEIINNWLDGDLNAMSSLNTLQPGGEFTQQCWAALRNVKAGTAISYQDLARRAGRPLAMRAAGTAMAQNLIAPIIPCHRVIKSNGEIGNYGFGISLKQQLLAHEGVEL